VAFLFSDGALAISRVSKGCGVQCPSEKNLEWSLYHRAAAYRAHALRMVVVQYKVVAASLPRHMAALSRLYVKLHDNLARA
jgi:hypothetical protein